LNLFCAADRWCLVICEMYSVVDLQIGFMLRTDWVRCLLLLFDTHKAAQKYGMRTSVLTVDVCVC